MSALVSVPLLGLCCWALAGGGDKQKFPDPTPRKDAILKRFAEEFVLLTPGKGKFPADFIMGTTKFRDKNEEPAHKVTFKHPFAICKYEVTQELY
jgi:formylglycine-generating enzyme required for sulfatase activity